MTQCAYGLALAGHSNPLVNNGNRIVHNSSIGIWNDANYKATAAEVPFPVINGNAIHDNGSYNYYPYRWYYYPNLAQVDLNARENWWGTTDELEIRNKIYDYEDAGNSLPNVDFGNYLSSAEAEPAPLTPLNGTLAANTTLTAEHPYYVSETVTVPANKTLTVPAGSKLLFASGAGITVQAGGHLVMQGSASSPVVLGSADTDNQAGDWEGIKAEAGATVSLEHVQASEYTSMDFQNGSVTIRHSRFGKFSGYGLLLTSTDGLLANNVIDNTGYTGGTVCLQLVDASPTVQGNLLTQCAYGLALAGHSNPLVNNGNRIVHNSSIGIWNDANYKATAAEVPFPVINGNAIHDNGSYNYYPYRWYYYPNLAQVDLNARENWWGTTDELEIRNKIYDYEDAGNSLPNVDFGNYLSSAEAEPAPLTPLNGTLAANTTLTAEHPYYVSETVTVPANKTLTVPAGSKLLFASGAGITVQAGGHLVMQGSASSPVVLGSADTDNQAGDWEGIKAEAGATVSLEHVQASEYTSMDFQNGSVTIRHSRFGKFSGYGLLLTSTDGLLANNVVTVHELATATA
ncbi:MAG: right-handed parallel beta-helix repeat-containing protein [Candidatus Thiothrix putei]|uniref:Right-handed parallel beta-helix repeat-containing protein n=1 Tax=Candidatus Thiothrix putei TaxID=3080811 RepID=A0AA95HG15_9GAMM|nr:MAG: right-handed parallel beta-helix repeat-containing protein [Candidatus Thiothrix putei]